MTGIPSDVSNILSTMGVAAKALLWCRMNRGEWPEEFGVQRSPEITREIFFSIMEDISYKECLRAWNIDRYPGDAFDKWWDISRQDRHSRNVLQ